MTEAGLRQKSWDQLLNEVEGISNAGTKQQMQSVLAVPAKAAQEISDNLKETAAEIQRFNASTGRLTKVLIWLNVFLVITAAVQAISTFFRR